MLFRPSHTAPTFTSFNRRSLLLAAAAGWALPAPQLAAAPSPAGAWPRASQVPGGVALLPLGPAVQRPLAYAGEVPLLVLGDASGWTALVGIALSAAPGEASITVQAADGSRRELAYTIAPKRYSEQHLKVEPRTVDLSPEDLARYERERAHQDVVMATFSEPPAPGLAAHAAAHPGTAIKFLRPAPRLQRPAPQPAQRHGHRGPDRHARAGAPAGPGDRHRRLFL
jgi:hypothetical protein